MPLREQSRIKGSSQSSAPPAGVPACKAWCGKYDDECQERWCSVECMDSCEPLNPPPSDPVTVATGGVPAGFRLGDYWTTEDVAGFECDSCPSAAAYVLNHVDPEAPPRKVACLAHAAEMGALVPIDTARSVPPGPLICDRCKVSAIPGDTKCWRCNWGKLIQEPVSPPVPPGSVRDSIDALRYAAQGVPPGPVPVEVDRQGNPRVYPCADCGTMRSLPEGGTTFTVCDECWDKRYPKESAPTPVAPASEPAVRPNATIADLSRRLVEMTQSLVAEYDLATAARAEVEQLRGKLGSMSNEVLRLTNVVAHQGMEVADAKAEATARVLSMREAAAKETERLYGVDNVAAKREALPFVPWSKEAEMKESWSAPQADAIKAAVDKANNRAADAFRVFCGADANGTPLGRMYTWEFEAWLRSGEDAPGAVTPAKGGK